MISATELARSLGLPAPTPEQAAIIEAPLEPGLVVAGAGSGKTETMAGRVVYLVASGTVRPEEVLGLTFTRKAAAALSQRIRRRLALLPAALAGGPGAAGAGPAGDPDVSTYHAFGGRLISEFGPLAGVEPAARVLTPTGAWQLARRVVGRWDADLLTDLGPDQVTERLLAISSALADHLTDVDVLSAELETVLQRLRSAPPGPRQRQALHSGLTGPVKRLQDRQWILPLVEAYMRAKREHGVVDFADQMQVAAALVRDHPRIATAMRDRYRVVLLDEYQDTGHAQRVILRGLFGAGTAEPGAADGLDTGRRPAGTRVAHPVTAVGDPVQSIYSWRGASASNLPRFVTDFPLATGRPSAVRSLLTSFRNPAAVLALANEVSTPVRHGGRVEVGELRPAPGAPAGCVRYGLFGTAALENAWLAGVVAGYWREALDAAGPGAAPPTTAVLVRRRSDMADTAEALRAAGLPVEVVGLGGLLDEPEVADLVATLRVLVDPTAGAAAIRLLTGARWQLGAADLEALANRARELAGPARGIDPEPGAAGADQPDAVAPQAAGSGQGVAGGDPVAPVRAAVTAALPVEDIDTWSLIDAAADPGPAQTYSPRGYRRLQRWAGQLHRLRGRMAQPLPDLIADLERAGLLDVETLASGTAGRAHLDAFGTVVAEVAATGAGPVELLEYLDAAAEREDGLTPGEVPQPSGRVQVLTVHAAKGLEWEVVAVPHLTEGVFPITRGSTWLGDPAQLPPQIRGDGADLPQLALPADGTQKDLADALTAHTAEFADLRLTEERRLLYVALTRTERTLLFSGHHWGPGTAKPAGPSEFLLECARWAEPFGQPDEWAEAPDPQDAQVMAARTAIWPVDPLGARRDAVQAGADRVLVALAELGSSGGDAGSPAGGDAGSPAGGDAGSPAGGDFGSPAGGEAGSVGANEVDTPAPAQAPPLTGSGYAGQVDPGSASPNDDPFGWAADVTTLLAERSTRTGPVLDVELPGTISVTSLVELADDPAELARRLSRPVPVEPAGRLRRGSDFHAWLEHRYRGDALLDLRDLPGAGDAWVGQDAELEQLKRRFLESAWADRVPIDVEVPFATRIAGMGVRGRVDAIFADADGGVTVVDWKAGRPAIRDEPAAVQLACYRLAIAELLELPLDRVRAAFHYVRAGVTVAPADLLDANGIAELIAAKTVAPAVRS